MKKTVAVIVLNFKTPQYCLDLTESLLQLKQTHFTPQVILIDNGSPDDSLNQFQKKYSQNKLVTIIETGANLGYAAGNNVGIDYALKNHFDYLLIINSDVTVNPDFLEKMVVFHRSHPQYSIISPKIYFAAGHEFHHDRYQENDRGKVIWSAGGHIDWDNVYGSNLGIDEVDHGQFDQINDRLNFVSGCCLFTDAKVFSQVRPFDPDYFMYFEDADFSTRALKAGLKIVYYPPAVIWHINAGSSTAGASPLVDYFLTRNRLLIGFKYASFRTKFALFRDSIRTLLTSPSKWQKRGVVDFYLHKLGKGSWQ